MRVAAFTELTGPEGVAIQERAAPEPGPGEAVVTVEACSINRHDLWVLEGGSVMVTSDQLPFVTGLDVAGRVASVGAGVTAVEPGDRVVLCPNETCGHCEFCREGPENLCAEFSLYHGGLAEQALVEADRLVTLPDEVDTTTAAALPTAYMTAWHMLRKADVTAGDLVFVPGATGGVGVAAVQLLDVMGATIVGTSRSAEKLAQVTTLGLDHAIESGDVEEIETAVREIGRPDAVMNHLGGPFTRLGLRVMKRNGRMVICGRTAGPTSEVDLGRLFLSHQHVVGSTMGTQTELERLVELVADDAFDPPVDATYALDETAQAFTDMQSNDVVGKLVIEPGR